MIYLYVSYELRVSHSDLIGKTLVKIEFWRVASVCLRRWKQKGLVEPAGERAGIYFNKLRAREVDSALRVAALLFEYPSAILCGESVLHSAGWITQIPGCPQFGVIRFPAAGYGYGRDHIQLADIDYGGGTIP